MRVADRDWRGGARYKASAVVLDVTSPGVGVLRYSDGATETGVPEKVLQSALPSVGGRLVVLRGQLRGEQCVLLERRGDVVHARMVEDDARVEALDVNAVAEWVGE